MPHDDESAKKLLEDYCKKKGITVEEFLEIEWLEESDKREEEREARREEREARSNDTEE